MHHSILPAVVLGFFGVTALPATVLDIYRDRPEFESNLGRISTDLSEIGYESTGFPESNEPDQLYCQGCPGTFRLIFTHTTVTTRNRGVFGVGMELWHSEAVDADGHSKPTALYITLGNGFMGEYETAQLPSGEFIGFTSPQEIVSIHFALLGGETSQEETFFFAENLTFGSPAPPAKLVTSTRIALLPADILETPEPATGRIFALGLGALLLARRRRQSFRNFSN